MTDIKRDVDHILENSKTELDYASNPKDNPLCVDYRYCVLHSGIKEAIRYLARDGEAQWTAIRQINNRIWAILLGVCATFFTVLIQLYFQHMK